MLGVLRAQPSTPWPLRPAGVHAVPVSYYDLDAYRASSSGGEPHLTQPIQYNVCVLLGGSGGGEPETHSRLSSRARLRLHLAHQPDTDGRCRSGERLRERWPATRDARRKPNSLHTLALSDHDRRRLETQCTMEPVRGRTERAQRAEREWARGQDPSATTNVQVPREKREVTVTVRVLIIILHVYITPPHGAHRMPQV